MTAEMQPTLVALKTENVADARLFANRDDALEMWPRNARIAEVGVAYGLYSEKIIKATAPKVFDAFDLFNLHEMKTLWGNPPSTYFGNKTQLQFYIDRFKKYEPATVIRTFVGDSSTELTKRMEVEYDVIYLDGDHTLDGVKRDTAAAIKRLAPNGLLVFNDYVLYAKKDTYGVVPVVNDLCVNHGWKVVYLALQREMFCDIALAR